MNKIFTYICITSAIALSGCAAEVIASNERTAIVNAHPRDAAGALTLAQEQCSKFGRHARLSETPYGSRQWVFDCIK